jgi:hypothetical protein
MNRAGRFICVPCKNFLVRRWFKAHPEYAKQYNKQYRAEHRHKFYELQIDRQRRHPDRVRANELTRNAKKNGTLVKAEHCEQCDNQRVEAHHDDYSQPLNVRWLCKACHGLADRQRRQRERERASGLEQANA